jgi:hypothetical protein
MIDRCPPYIILEDQLMLSRKSWAIEVRTGKAYQKISIPARTALFSTDDALILKNK